jgi:hypothetical protein
MKTSTLQDNLDLPSNKTSRGESSLLSASALTSLLTSTPLSLSHDGQGLCINNRGIVDYQKQRRDFVLRSITSAATGIVVVPPLLDPALAVVVDGEAAATASAVTINPSAQLTRITHKVYLDVEFGSKRGKKGRLVIGLFGDVMPRVVGNFLAICPNRGSGNAGFLPTLVRHFTEVRLAMYFSLCTSVVY